MTKHKIQKTIKFIIFTLIFIIIFKTIFSILWVDKSQIYTTYNEPNNSLDIIYIGASNVRAHFNPLISFDKYGYAVGLFTSNAQPFDSVKYIIKETRKTQNPSLYIIDISKLADNLNSFTEADIRRSTDSLKFSVNRKQMIDEILSNRNYDKNEYPNFYFSFLLYHNRWKDLLKGTLYDGTNNYKGYSFSAFTNKIDSLPEYVWINNSEKLPKVNEQILNDLINYIKENNINVLFVISKRYYNETIIKRLNYSTKLLENNNFKVLNFNKIDTNINEETDFYNRNHLNVYGATKYTLYFSKYLKNNYNLKDHRNDSNYKSWITEYTRFKTDFKKLNKIEFDELLN